MLSPRHIKDLRRQSGKRNNELSGQQDIQSSFVTRKFLSKNGILPWYMINMMEKLTKAFKEKRKTKILFLAADLGHYIGDAHMPLHTSDNHDGQLTGQKGIHAFWETQLPELFGKEYNYKSEDAKYIRDIEKEVWTIIFNSHSLADTLLLADKNLKKSFQEDKIYKVDSSGKIIKNKFINLNLIIKLICFNQKNFLIIS